MAPIDRDFDLLALREDVGRTPLPRVVLVQTVAQEAETRDLLRLAVTDPLVAGVVGWVDLTGPEVADRLAGLLAADGGPMLVGVRHLLQDEADPAWLDRSDVRRGVQAVAAAGLALDLVIRCQQLTAVVGLAEALPGLRVVLDHLGKPSIATGEREPWRTDLAALARQSNATVKLSGLVTEAHWASWTPEQLAPYARVALAEFGPDRVMFGSDWPVSRLATTYQRWLATARQLTADLDPAEQGAVFNGTARKVYRLAAMPEVLSTASSPTLPDTT